MKKSFKSAITDGECLKSSKTESTKNAKLAKLKISKKKEAHTTIYTANKGKKWISQFRKWIFNKKH